MPTSRRETDMSNYRVQLPEQYVQFLTEPGGTLATKADHVRDGSEYDAPGYTYLDGTAMAALRELPEDSDGHADEDRIWFEGKDYAVEYVA
jgi:hypothetical protein